MPFNLHFSAAEILWTLTFAAILVLLVVLMGRDRISRFPWFTASIVGIGLRMLAGRLLYQKMAPIRFTEISLTLGDIITIISLMVAIELARRAFQRASRNAWVAGTVALLVLAGTVIAFWGPWPQVKTLTAGTTISNLRLMQMFAQRGDLFVDLLYVQLGILVAFAGRRFHAGWRSHTQQILIGLSTVAIAQIVLRVVWTAIQHAAPPRSQAEYDTITGLQSKLIDSNSVIFLIVLLWWIACLWINEPGSAASGSLPDETPAG
jgi:hypothetical protein